MFKLIPCNFKIPLIKDWTNGAGSDDPDQWKLWSELHKEKLTHWGILTGKVNDILVLDIDIKNNGFESIKVNNLVIPKTRSQRTLSGGMHYFFKFPKDGNNYGNRVGIYPGIDVRANGGFVCHYGLDNTEIAEAPEWLLQSANKPVVQHTGNLIQIAPGISEKTIHEALQSIREAPAGESNDTLNRESFKIGQLVASGSISREYAESILFSAALDRGKPEREARATIRSGLDGGSGKPLTTPFGEPVATIPIPAAPVVERWTPKPFTLEDLLNVNKLKKPQLFKDWSTEDITITTADGGTGKTTLTLYESICLALGKPFLGFPCVQPGKTLYVTGEDTAGKLGAMIGAITQGMGISAGSVELNTVLDSIVVKKDSDLCIINKDRQGFLHPSSDAMRKVLEAVYDIKPKKIVFDPISSFWGSESALNDMAKAVSKFMSHLVEESRACVELINHMGKVSSTNKDMSQFAGRGGTGLPSHARVSRVLRSVHEDEYQELTGKTLNANQQVMMCNVGKFSDGSPLYNKPFLIIRDGYIFSRQDLAPQKQREIENQSSDIERVFNFIKSCRLDKKYPTKNIVVSHFMGLGDPISQARINRALEMLMFTGFEDTKVAEISNINPERKERQYILTDLDGKEV